MLVFNTDRACCFSKFHYKISINYDRFGDCKHLKVMDFSGRRIFIDDGYRSFYYTTK